MKIFFALLMIVFLAFSGYHLTFRGFRLPLFARKFYLTGTEFLFLGLLIGPQFLNILDQETRKGLDPLSALLLGWIGMIFGFQFEIVKLRRFPLEYLTAAILEGLLTFVAVFFAVYFTLPLFFDITDPMKIVASLTLAAAAACTAQTGLALLAPDIITKRQDTVRFLKYISSIDGLSALLIFGLAFFFRPLLFAEPSWIWKLGLGVSVSLGASAGLLLLYILLFSRRRQESELILVVIGMVVLTSGMASVIRFSPLIANFFIGLFLVNLLREKESIYQILISIEKPVYLLLLLLLGVSWDLDSAWFFLLAAVYSLYRISGKFFAGFLITHLSPELKRYPRCLGFGLVDSGGLPLAILFDFQQGFPHDATAGVISLALLAVIYNDFLSPHFFKQLIGK